MTKWMNQKEIAKYLGVERNTIYRMVKECGLPSHRITKGKTLFDPDEIDKWIRRK